MDGFINLNKAAGWTSHDCVAKVRRLLRQKKVGHAGTLDPAAIGVLPIAIGRATRLLQFLRGDKAYRATVRFGIRTTTDDLEGEVLNRHDASPLKPEKIVPWLSQFKGVIQQVPPSYSAIQVGGKRLYDLARSGHDVEVPVRTVEVYRIDVLDWRHGAFPEMDLAIACGSGTYIRAIARDLGEYVGTGATLAHLVRTESSGFSLADSLTLEDLEQHIQQGQFSPIAPEIALQHLPAVHLEREMAKRWRMGQKIPIEPPAEMSSVTQSKETNIRCVFEEGDRFLGIGELTQLPQEETPSREVLRPRMVFLPT